MNDSNFVNELKCLATEKLVRIRIEKLSEEKQENYEFRHDRIWDFFNAQIIKRHDKWCEQYFKDGRFRGAFLALAWSLPLNEAQNLKDKIERDAVQRTDYSLHNPYYQLLDLRNRLPQL